MYPPSPSNFSIYSWYLNRDVRCETVNKVMFNSFAVLYIIASTSMLTELVHSSCSIKIRSYIYNKT